MDDPRFQNIFKDPRSKRIPKNVRKIKVDKRFQNMFNENKQFKESSKLDERGRKLDLTSSENLKKLYNITDSSEEEDEVPANKNAEAEDSQEVVKSGKSTPKAKHSEQTKHAKSNKTIHDVDEKTRMKDKTKSDKEKIKKAVDEAEDESADTGEEESESSDSDTDDSEESIKGDGEFDHRWEELHKEAPDTDEITKRIAVCNMDWDRIRADDLFAVFNSFKPPDSCVYSVKIYPSEYGSKRMEEEKLNGPPELVEETLDPDEEEVEDKKGSRYHREKLRQYQMNRLRYYYAVVDCDTPETANTLYEQLNGMEYESSSVRFDLRFIPDDVTFDQEPSSAADKIPDPTEYKPRLFVTTALQQVKVNLTWDETDPRRRETLQRAFTEPESIEKDIKDYLASSSGDSEEESVDEDDETDRKLSTKDRISKYKQLLQSLEDKDKKEDEKYEMEITWEPGLKEKTEKLVKEKMEDTSSPFEEMLKKKREDRKLKRKEKKTEIKEDQVKDSSASEESDSDLQSDDNAKKESKKVDELYLISDSKKLDRQEEKTTKKKKKNYKKAKPQKMDDFKCNVMDPRFSAVYTSHEYNIDPSDPHFKKTGGSLAIIEEKQNRLKNKESPSNEKRKNKKFKYS